MEVPMRSLKDTIMTRDGLSADEADDMIADARKQVLEDGVDPEDVLLDDFGLEPDYILDLLGM
jgi:hypothetical protein